MASLPRRDQIAIGKAIVGRLGKDDNWVTNSTAGWTFAAATREMPEGCRRPVSVEKLRQASTYCTAIAVQQFIRLYDDCRTYGATCSSQSILLRRIIYMYRAPPPYVAPVQSVYEVLAKIETKRGRGEVHLTIYLVRFDVVV